MTLNKIDKIIYKILIDDYKNEFREKSSACKVATTHSLNCLICPFGSQRYYHGERPKEISMSCFDIAEDRKNFKDRYLEALKAYKELAEQLKFEF